MSQRHYYAKSVWKGITTFVRFHDRGCRDQFVCHSPTTRSSLKASDPELTAWIRDWGMKTVIDPLQRPFPKFQDIAARVYEITDSFTSVTPAHGRDYKSKALAIADFEKNMHFIHAATGRVCSLTNFAPGCVVNIRYRKLRSVCSYTVKAPDGT